MPGPVTVPRLRLSAMHMRQHTSAETAQPKPTANPAPIQAKAVAGCPTARARAASVIHVIGSEWIARATGAGTRAGPVAAGCDGADGVDGVDGTAAEGTEAGYGIADIESIGAMHRNKPFIKACPAILADHAIERTINRMQDTLTPSSRAVWPRG